MSGSKTSMVAYHFLLVLNNFLSVKQIWTVSQCRIRNDCQKHEFSKQSLLLKEHWDSHFVFYFYNFICPYHFVTTSQLQSVAGSRSLQAQESFSKKIPTFLSLSFIFIFYLYLLSFFIFIFFYLHF